MRLKAYVFRGLCKISARLRCCRWVLERKEPILARVSEPLQEHIKRHSLDEEAIYVIAGVFTAYDLRDVFYTDVS